MQNKSKCCKIFSDILKENSKYSQGRIYLLWSIIAYYITICILTWAGIRNNRNGSEPIDIENFKIIIDALEYAMTLFGGYVFGGKFVELYKQIKGSETK